MSSVESVPARRSLEARVGERAEVHADTRRKNLVTDTEGRFAPQTQSLGWEHYETHAPEPHIVSGAALAVGRVRTCKLTPRLPRRSSSSDERRTTKPSTATSAEEAHGKELPAALVSDHPFRLSTASPWLLGNPRGRPYAYVEHLSPVSIPIPSRITHTSRLQKKREPLVPFSIHSMH